MYAMFATHGKLRFTASNLVYFIDNVRINALLSYKPSYGFTVGVNNIRANTVL